MKQRFSKRTRLVSALLTLAMVFTFLPISAFAEEELTDNYGIIPLAEYVLPDKAFREYLKKFDTNGDNILAPAERYAVTTIDVDNKNISNLYGIQFFPNLKELDCSGNQLTSLDVSENPALLYLNCSENQLTKLDVRENPALMYLYCSINQLTKLDVSENPALVDLSCSGNQLTELDVSSNTALKRLYCNNNQLTSLDTENCTILTNLACDNNEYSVEVYSGTRILDLSILPGKFDVDKMSNPTNAYQNPDRTLTVNPNVNKVTYDYSINENESLYATFTLNVTVIPEGSIGINASNFPDPNFRAYVKAKFDTDKNNSLSESERNAVTEIDVREENISNLYGIQFFPNLLYLNCMKNQLSSLDVSQNAKLVHLYCNSNKLTSLDVSKNTNLTELECYENQLTELDVRQNAALTYLGCSKNNLTSLDVSKNTNLTEFGCYENQLTSLDVGKNTNLKILVCFDNQLTSLDVSKNTALEKLYCYSNQLTSLDVSQTAVTDLNIKDNQIDINVEETPRTFDLSTLPGTFDVSKATNWNGGTVSGKKLKVNEGTNQVTYTYDCGKGLSRDFTLYVKVVPDGTVTPPSGGDNPGGGSTPGGTTPGGSTGGGDGGGAVVIVAAVGAVAAGVVGYGVYNYVSGQKLQALLPEGVAAPENRAQTALLLWNTAGRPEPAEAPAFADVADPDTAKAAQWCVEQGLMKRRLNGKFAPGSSIPAYQVLNAYRKLAG